MSYPCAFGLLAGLDGGLEVGFAPREGLVSPRLGGLWFGWLDSAPTVTVRRFNCASNNDKHKEVKLAKQLMECGKETKDVYFQNEMCSP